MYSVLTASFTVLDHRVSGKQAAELISVRNYIPLRISFLLIRSCSAQFVLSSTRFALCMRVWKLASNSSGTGSSNTSGTAKVDE